MNYRFLITPTIVILLSTLVYITHRPSQPGFGASVVDALSGSGDLKGFARATRVRRFVFPEDAGPHPEFQTEWWYYTGNLEDGNGRHFGFQLTFFRRTLSPDVRKRHSRWATNQIYLAHFAVSDTKNRAFYPSERWSRGAAGLAGATVHPFHVWIDDWSATEEGKSLRLRAKSDQTSIDLTLTSLKPIVLHGELGLSRKGAEPGNASYYYSQTRLDTIGTITIKDEIFEVRGLSWLDREWSTSALNRNQVGWDWFSIQLNDRREIMLYQIRLKDGGIDPNSSGSLIEPDGTVRPLGVDDFRIEVLGSWKSPRTGVVYPSGWHIDIPDYGIKMEVVPYQPNQEIPLTFTYWEGAVKIEGRSVSGNGYVELTGYARKSETGSYESQ
jgi:predicted secreted hydrolase